jgi:hypothetical protein
MERETGIEPATFSLGNRQQIENKEHSVHGVNEGRQINALFSRTCFGVSLNGAVLERKISKVQMEQ